jgi:hypothetical protein
MIAFRDDVVPLVAEHLNRLPAAPKKIPAMHYHDKLSPVSVVTSQTPQESSAGCRGGALGLGESVPMCNVQSFRPERVFVPRDSSVDQPQPRSCTWPVTFLD